VLISRVTEQSTQLEKLAKVETDLDERIRFIENDIHVNSLFNSIHDYKEQVKHLLIFSKYGHKEYIYCIKQNGLAISGFVHFYVLYILMI